MKRDIHLKELIYLILDLRISLFILSLRAMKIQTRRRTNPNICLE